MKQTKQKVIDAAISLFNTKGYDGTSVREKPTAVWPDRSLIGPLREFDVGAPGIKNERE